MLISGRTGRKHEMKGLMLAKFVALWDCGHQIHLWLISVQQRRVRVNSASNSSQGDERYERSEASRAAACVPGILSCLRVCRGLNFILRCLPPDAE
jgi:hypothetical protein